MILFKNDDYFISCNSPTLWDVDEAGLTGKWRVGDKGYDFFQIEIWYTYTRSKWIFFTEKCHDTLWVDHFDIHIKDYNYWSEYNCNSGV